MVANNVKLHLTDGKIKTTITLAPRLFNYLAIALGILPDAPGAKAVVSRFLNERITTKYGSFASRNSCNPGTSDLAREISIDTIVSKDLRDKHSKWLCGETE